MTTLVSESNVVDDVPEHYGVMAVLDRSGDTKITWDRGNADEVANARRTFDELVGQKRFSAYSVDRHGDKSEQVRTFDPAAEKLILTAPLVGG